MSPPTENSHLVATVKPTWVPSMDADNIWDDGCGRLRDRESITLGLDSGQKQEGMWVHSGNALWSCGWKCVQRKDRAKLSLKDRTLFSIPQIHERGKLVRQNVVGAVRLLLLAEA